MLFPYQNKGPAIAFWQQGITLATTLIVNGNNYQYYSDSGRRDLYITQSNLTISYYCRNNDFYQFNASGGTYYYGGLS